MDLSWNRLQNERIFDRLRYLEHVLKETAPKLMSAAILVMLLYVFKVWMQKPLASPLHFNKSSKQYLQL